MLRVAAVIGPTFSGELLATLEGGRRATPSTPSRQASSLDCSRRMARGRWAFVHAVVHDAIYDAW